MLAFFVQLARFIVVIARGVRSDEEFRILSILLLTLLAGGTVFYAQMENWPWLDSLYFCVMTISTIGYGDLVPTTSISKIFTIIYALMGIGLFVSVVTKIVAIIVRRKVHEKI